MAELDPFEPDEESDESDDERGDGRSPGLDHSGGGAKDEDSDDDDIPDEPVECTVSISKVSSLRIVSQLSYDKPYIYLHSPAKVHSCSSALLGPHIWRCLRYPTSKTKDSLVKILAKLKGNYVLRVSAQRFATVSYIFLCDGTYMSSSTMAFPSVSRRNSPNISASVE
jgi:hypothetical protein